MNTSLCLLFLLNESDEELSSSKNVKTLNNLTIAKLEFEMSEKRNIEDKIDSELDNKDENNI